MADLKKYPDEVWDRFFGFVFPDEPISREQVQQELKRLGLDVKRAAARVRLALQATQARAELDAARLQRPRLMEKLRQVVVPAATGLRNCLEKIIGERLQGSLQAAYFRKLESAATDDDLQSLLEDLYRLEAMEEGAGDGKPGGE